jgi:hypothetical protein
MRRLTVAMSVNVDPEVESKPRSAVSVLPDLAVTLMISIVEPSSIVAMKKSPPVGDGNPEPSATAIVVTEPLMPADRVVSALFVNKALEAIYAP